MAGNRENDPLPNGANGSGPYGRDRPADPLAAGAQDQVDLQDKVALIVGGTTGDGQALALAFARRGMDIVLLYFGEGHHSAAAVKEQVEAHGRRCLLISWADFGSDGNENRFAKQAMQHVRETFGRLDVFINLSARSHALNGNGNGASEAQKKSLRSRLFPHLKITKAALGQIVESGPEE